MNIQRSNKKLSLEEIIYTMGTKNYTQNKCIKLVEQIIKHHTDIINNPKYIMKHLTNANQTIHLHSWIFDD